MELIELKCPECGAILTVQDNVEIFYCEHCGTKLMITNQSEASINSKTKIKLSEHRLEGEKYKIDAKYNAQKHKLDLKYKEKENDNKVTIALLIFALILYIAVGLSIAYMSSKPTKELNKLIETTQQYIADENYSAARIEANKIIYTGGGIFSKEKTKWDKARKELLKQIEEGEKAQKKSEKETEKSESDNFWSWLPWVD